jgi:hypothetical protein
MTNPPDALDEAPLPLSSETLPSLEPSPGGDFPLSAPPPSEPRLPGPIRTLPLLALFLAVAGVLLAFTYATVHRRTAAELAANSGMTRGSFSVNFWIDHGYFHSGGLLMRPSPNPPGYFIYLSSTGGHMVSGFLAEKIYKSITGRTSIGLLALHSEIVALVLAALIGLLSFRLAQRFGSSPLHAFILAASVEIVHFTFPDNLALFWELSGRQPFLIFAVIFLIIEEQRPTPRTRVQTLGQGLAAFLLTYMEYAAGMAFLASFFVVTSVVAPKPTRLRQLLAITILPAVLALGLFGLQRKWAVAHHADAATYGGSFLFRSGLDGSTQYYRSHLDIATRRDTARANFPPNQSLLFRWKWLFIAGTAAMLALALAAARGRVPKFALLTLLSLLGTYLLYAAVFSQAFVIHPYLFDILLYTPLVLALLVIAPAHLESITEQRGVFVAAVFFLAAWIAMVQLRDYAMWYPLPPQPSATKALLPEPTARS